MNGETLPEGIIYSYEVLGLPHGEAAHITNRDYPGILWSILRIRNGVPNEQPTGNYRSAQDALTVLQEQYK